VAAVAAVTAQAQITSFDRFGLTLCLAVILHGIIILGVSFVPEDSLQPRYNTMEIILVQQRSQETPEDAKILAQANLVGGGEVAEEVNPATPTPAPFPEQTAEITAPPPVEEVPPPAPTPPPTSEIVTESPEPEPQLVKETLVAKTDTSQVDQPVEVQTPARLTPVIFLSVGRIIAFTKFPAPSRPSVRVASPGAEAADSVGRSTRIRGWESAGYCSKTPRHFSALFPEINSDIVTVRVPYPGAAPEEVEEGIVIRVEEAVQDLEGIQEIDHIQRVDLFKRYGICTITEEAHAVQGFVWLADFFRSILVRQLGYDVELRSRRRFPQYIKLVIDPIFVGPVEL